MNPSSAEFTDDNDKAIYPERFPETLDLETAMNTYFDDPDNLRSRNNEKSNPYWYWFRNLEKELKYFDTSYFSTKLVKNAYSLPTPEADTSNKLAPQNRALHIDFETGIATHSNWTTLSATAQSLISSHENFKKLFSYLSPHTAVLYSRLDVFNEFIRVINNGQAIRPTFILKSGETIDPDKEDTEKTIGDINVGIIPEDCPLNKTNTTLIWVKNSRSTNRCYGKRIRKYLEKVTPSKPQN